MEVHAFYNPLADNANNNTIAEEECLWTVVRPGLKYHSKPNSSSVCALPSPPVGCELRGRKEGQWLLEITSGLYLPYFSADKSRNFRNRKMMYLLHGKTLERTNSSSTAASYEEPIKRVVSEGSKSSSSSLDADRRRSTSFVSFEDANINNGTAAQPQVWVCCAFEGVGFYSEQSFRAATSSPECVYGQEVRAVRDGKWLCVVEEEAPALLTALQVVGRRSFRSRQAPLRHTGLYLPLCRADGTRLFKHQHLAALEEIQRKERQEALPRTNTTSTAAADAGCTLM
mmetsp:Transcript_43231/g.92486  ORF Transcript_43231/g.92486 Transcript_43231/m.92486 type:complete len:285 (-) Transcript_43231:111-965(-)|eukprot:CAMPEP_0206464092 /NCGR_PEP_ID=MMETSP0324_2-20121206/27006_1 /ASSEMBLY_ACC=CAM_ASM_000836 /TAXON_ID=2866 /ORGANISM="Crypthecodinium cohnii, Strain Seligo" /LENGTH=284 /DNA_ID=CAMNT_0053936649 /DNA_START=114 /DNA_END=968 /DNA_ORIENTATION=+